MDPHAPPGVFGSEPFSPVDFLGRAGETLGERAKRHKDTSYNLEHWGAERVWVVTTGLAVGDFPWPALVVPDPPGSKYFLPKGFHAPQFEDTHVAVMLLGLGDTRRHSEYQWFRYVSRASHGIVTRFSARAFENWLPAFCKKLVEAGAKSGDPLVAADGLDAAFRMVDKFPTTRKVKESALSSSALKDFKRTVAETTSLRLHFLALARRAAQDALGPEISQTVKPYDGGVRAFLAQRNVSLEHVEYNFSSNRALLGEEHARSFFLNEEDARDKNAIGSAFADPTPTPTDASNRFDEDDPARLLVAAACACAEQAAGQAERDRLRAAVAAVSPLRLGGAGAPLNAMDGVDGTTESRALGRVLASVAPSPAARASFAPAAVGATGLAGLIAHAQARASPLSSLSHFSNANATPLASGAAAAAAAAASPAFLSSAAPLGRTPFLATPAGYDPLEIPMVPQRRAGSLSREWTPLGLAAPLAGGATPVGASPSFGFGSARLNTHSVASTSASPSRRVHHTPPTFAVASRLKIEDADDVLDEGDKVVSPIKNDTPKPSPKKKAPVDRDAANLFGAAGAAAAIATAITATIGATPPTPSAPPVAPPVAPPTASAAIPSTAPRAEDESGANGAATPSPDVSSKDAEAAKKAKRRENDRLRRLKNKAKAESERENEARALAAETVCPYEARRRGERKRSRSSSKDDEVDANDEAPEHRLGEEEEERLAGLEMEEARRVIARLVGGAETERLFDEKTKTVPVPARLRKRRTKTSSAAFARAPRMALASSDEEPSASARSEGDPPIEDRTDVGAVPKKKIEKKPYAPPPRFDKKFAPDFSKREAYPLPLEPRGFAREAPSPGKEAEDERRVSGSPAGSPAGSPGRKIRLLRDIYGEDWERRKPGTRNARGKRLGKSVSRVSVDRPSERGPSAPGRNRTRNRIDAARTRSDAPPRRSRRRETAEPFFSEPSPSEPSPSEHVLAVSKKKPRVVDDDDEGALDAASFPPFSKTSRSGGKKRPPRGKKKEPKHPKDPKGPTEREPKKKRASLSKAPRKKTPAARDPTSPLTMAPAPAGSIFASLEETLAAVSFAEQKERTAEKRRFDAKRYRCAVFECDRERVSDFFVTRYGDAGEVRESRFCEIALGVTPERLLRLKGTHPGSYFFKHEKTRALNASLFAFGDSDATDEEATAFASAFVAQGGMVVRHFAPSDEKDALDEKKDESLSLDAGAGLGTRSTKRSASLRRPTKERLGNETAVSVSTPADDKGTRGEGEGEGEDKTRTDPSRRAAAETDTWTTWSGRRTTVKSVPPPSSKRVRKKPAPDLGPWLASLRRAHKGESVSETCFYVSQRLVPKFKARRRSVPRLPKDADGNPVETNEETSRDGIATYYDSDDDAVAPSETLGFVEVAGSFFKNPAVLLATPTEVAYLGIKPNEGSGLPLYAANAADAERLNRTKTPTYSLFCDKARGETNGVNENENENENEEEAKAFHASVLSLDDVLFDAAAQGSEMMRDMRLAERETFSLMHNRSGMPLRFRYLEFDVPLCRAKLEAIARQRELHRRGGLSANATADAAADGARDGRNDDDDDRGDFGALATKKNKALRFFGVEAEKSARRDEPNHAWDPRLLPSRPGNVARHVATAYFEDVHSPRRRSDVPGDSVNEKATSIEKDRFVDAVAGAPTLRFFAAGALVPLSCVRPLALSEVAYAYAATWRKKKRVYQTDTHSKKVLDATGFVWYTVSKSDVPKLTKYLSETCALAGNDAFGFFGKSGNGESHVRSLLDADSCDLRSPGLWLDPGAIARWNAGKEHKRDRIVVRRHVQRVGEHFARAPGAARWGVCVGGCWLAESRFAFPEDYASLARDAEETEKKSAFDVGTKTSSSVGPRDEGASDAARVVAGVRAETRKALAAEALLEAAAVSLKKNGEERGA